MKDFYACNNMDVWKHGKPESQKSQPVRAGVNRVTLAGTALLLLVDNKEEGFWKKLWERARV